MRTECCTQLQWAGLDCASQLLHWLVLYGAPLHCGALLCIPASVLAPSAKDDPQCNSCHSAHHPQPQQAILDHAVIHVTLERSSLPELWVVLYKPTAAIGAAAAATARSSLAQA